MHLSYASTTPPDAIAGLLAGYSQQFGATVVGIEADVGFSHARSSVISAKATVPSKANRMAT